MIVNYIAHRSGKRMMVLVGLLAALGALMLVVDLSSLIPADPSSFRSSARASTLETFAMILPWIGGFALLVALGVLPTLLRKRVEIEVTPSGIHYPPALNAALPWDRIERIAVRKMTIYRVLAVTIRDADHFPIKPLARKIAALNKASGDYGDINIETMRSDGDFDELLAAVENFAQVEPEN